MVENLESGGGDEGLVPGKMAMVGRGSPLFEWTVERPGGGDEVFPEFEGSWGRWSK